MVRIVKLPEQRRREIVEAAGQVFLQKGYESTTMQDVMQRLGIAKGTIYHYFSSKEELLDAVLENTTRSFQLHMQEVFSSLQGNALERLQVFLFNIAHHTDDHDGFVENLHKPANAGMHIRLQAKGLLMLAPFIAELLTKGKEEGIFSTNHPLECAEFILAAATFLTDVGIYPWNESQMERRIRALPALIEQQTGAPEGSFAFLLSRLPKDPKEGLQA